MDYFYMNLHAFDSCSANAFLLARETMAPQNPGEVRPHNTTIEEVLRTVDALRIPRYDITPLVRMVELLHVGATAYPYFVKMDSLLRACPVIPIVSRSLTKF